MQLCELNDYIGRLLETSRFRDYCPNGIQVEGRAEILRIASGVTASQRLLEAATAWGADAILVHHGYFWRNEDATVTGIKKRRLAHLLQHDVSLLAYHLPLDAHPVLGNNAQLAQRLEFLAQGRFGEQDIAWYGELKQAKALGQLAENITHSLQRAPMVIGNPSRELRRIAWCSGAAQGYFEQAIALGVDAFLTGEISEQNVHLAQETGVAFIAAGHHATERYGVQALGEHLARQFKIEHCFFDMDNPV
ncbi:MAG: Nif3-like dinuclear metal center hexameric protein [Gallionellales bacterium 35-53-114]|jgi:dinuclear metal center YbgI/SA1388 family protein|nr:MAG: Nif3-like dinuclear metal center hexameric protein [Gallionellales bacterium 35-53-114]OYZ64182.1 MAG: Nif3-like dinuclear metal center hexameric protein [Gallionellales bacterium 24-53-125]OZB10509.1 MAG: Nif3-like dinuclear metal center hexameric protein [Gallionellales bacterium 39-52-133]HQS57129.1 Nif3-like dinuclear metal center hexameric protein [Gallionellaceae bacterium]HQS74683.1 Nif3-like dinuclear metal center hexameric protein [Gallionellaceae bacterium]